MDGWILGVWIADSCLLGVMADSVIKRWMFHVCIADSVIKCWIFLSMDGCMLGVMAQSLSD